MGFPKDFIWGAATASYQIEGAAHKDGKGLSVWDVLCKKPGVIWSKNRNGSSGDVACDHYNLFKDDIALMKEIGLKAYRFSISWPRVLPNGVGDVNKKGLDFYNRLVDELLSNDIEPYITLFHWDYPHELFKKGGWLNPDCSDWFSDYTRVVVDSLSDRVKNWMTINEPQSFIGHGHQGTFGHVHAPGLQLEFSEVLQVVHNVLLSHGKAVQVIRSNSKTKASVGYVPVGMPRYPVTSNINDIEAARIETFAVRGKNCFNNSWFMDPVFLGKYPEDGLELFKNDMPIIKPGDMEIISQPLDFFSTNIYAGGAVRMNADMQPESVDLEEGFPITTFRWAVTPEAMYWGARFFYERYKLPIVITENGMANTDWVASDGKVHDPQRIDFLYKYLNELRRAVDDGVDVKGYFLWSLMDNFEWAEGYRERFGIIYVDYLSQKRVIKDSGYWYKKVIKSNGRILESIPEYN